MNDYEKQRLWELIGKRVAGEEQEDEKHELNGLLEKFPEALYTLEAVSQYWTALKQKTGHEEREAALEQLLLCLDENDEAAVPGMHESLPVAKPAVKRFAVMTAAAAAVFFLVFFGYRMLNRPQEKIEPKFITLAAAKGKRSQFTLPDGSAVWLNAGTTLSYPADFNTNGNREVSLSGEAFFKIKHDAGHPFLIHTEQMELRDLGTSFNVRSYPSEPIKEATLIEGSVEIQVKNIKGSTILSRPNEKITVNAAEVIQESVNPKKPAAKDSAAVRPAVPRMSVSYANPVPASDLLPETAWMKNVFLFRNESFENLAYRMEQWYDVKLRFEKEDRKKYRFSGAFSNETIEQALKELQLLRPFRFSIQDKEIIIR